MRFAAVAVLGFVVLGTPLALAAEGVKTEEAPKGWLGVQIRMEETKGQIVVEMVLPESPAEKAGLKEQDVILKLDKEEVTGLQSFVAKIGAKKPGDEITLRIKRDCEEKDVKVKLGEYPKGTN
jgi:S1-C subfamily serine protease